MEVLAQLEVVMPEATKLASISLLHEKMAAYTAARIELARSSTRTSKRFP